MARKLHRVVLMIVVCCIAYIYVWIPRDSIIIAHHIQPQDSADADDLVMANVSDINPYDICDENDKPRINIIVHHKTGTHLFREFMQTLKGYYRQQCNLTLNFGGGQWIQLSPNGMGPFINVKRHFNQYNTYIIIHSVRDPLDTILSAYNYHKLISPEAEQRNHAFDNFEQLKEYRRTHGGIYTEQRYCYNYMFFEESSPLKLNESLYHKYSVQSVLKNEFNLSMGLLYEYTRFFCYDAKDIVNTYKSLKELEREIQDGQYQGVTVFQVSMEQFHNNFNETALQTLDAMKILKRSDRKMLMNEFVKYNIHDNHTMDKRNSLIRQHITHGHFDRDKQIKILLGDKDRCINIKNMTYAINMEWKFNAYC